MCCGPVSVTNKELNKIKKKVKPMPPIQKIELKNQIRYHGTCIFYDLEEERVGTLSIDIPWKDFN